MKNRWKATLSLLGILLIPLPRAHSQTASLCAVTGAGAVEATDGTHRITATLGQTAIGTIMAGSTSLAQGFWHPLYRTSASPISGNEPTTGSALPTLHASPNPFSGSTQLSLRILQKGEVSLILYNALGQPLQNLMRGEEEAGEIEIRLATDDLPSGRYTLRFTTDRGTETLPLLLVK